MRCFNCRRRGLVEVGRGYEPDKCWYGICFNGAAFSDVLPRKRFLVRVCWFCWRSDMKWRVAVSRLELIHDRKITEGPLV